MVVRAMSTNDTVEEKSMTLGGIGMTMALAACNTAMDTMPSAGGGSMMTTS